MTSIKSFDSVVMLTWSNWFEEMRSNRYHYATRFAKHCPVIFVQPDLKKMAFHFEVSGCENLTILHIPRFLNAEALALLNEALLSRKIIKPLLWIYNVNFADFIIERYSALKVYHATEDYFSKEFYQDLQAADKIKKQLSIILQYADLLISVSEGVQESYCTNAQYKGKKLVLTNGCDFDFYKMDLQNINEKSKHQKIVLYQGNISDKLDFELLTQLILKMSDWEFWFCGKAQALKGWRKVLSLKNVKYHGCVSPEKLRELSYHASVGVIPFLQNNLIIERTFPLKAFEYVACGLPVVTVPIQSLLSYANVFHFARTADEFEALIKVIAQTRYYKQAIQNRLTEASKHSYDGKFEVLLDKIYLYAN